jgi:hypothetical protein
LSSFTRNGKKKFPPEQKSEYFCGCQVFNICQSFCTKCDRITLLMTLSFDIILNHQKSTLWDQLNIRKNFDEFIHFACFKLEPIFFVVNITFYYKLVGLPGFARDFNCQLCLFVSLSLCICLSPLSLLNLTKP